VEKFATLAISKHCGPTVCQTTCGAGCWRHKRRLNTSL